MDPGEDERSDSAGRRSFGRLKAALLVMAVTEGHVFRVAAAADRHYRPLGISRESVTLGIHNRGGAFDKQGTVISEADRHIISHVFLPEK